MVDITGINESVTVFLHIEGVVSIPISYNSVNVHNYCMI